MSISLIFWVLMILWLVLGLYTNRTTLGTWAPNGLLIFILFALLGWAVFGAAVHR